ncbi:MAG: hypothetical protein L0H41_12175 [Microlunatus sp.]|nr:hypothetical protein [Microlunatus sp.]
MTVSSYCCLLPSSAVVVLLSPLLLYLAQAFWIWTIGSVVSWNWLIWLVCPGLVNHPAW